MSRERTYISDAAIEEPMSDVEHSPLLQPFLERLKTEGGAVWQEFFDHILTTLNIEVDSVKRTSKEFSSMRQKLNIESGVLIANHPSMLDVIFVLSELERRDVLIMMQRKRFPFFEDVFGKEKVLRTPEGQTEVTMAIEKAAAHIQAGGLFIIFPSGGKEMATNKLQFNSGLRLLLDNVDPNNMVYSLYIDPVASNMIKENMMGAPRDPSDTPMLLGPELHVRPAQEHLVVKIDEAYSQAGEWKDIISKGNELDPIKQNDLLLGNFESKFKALL